MTPWQCGAAWVDTLTNTEPLMFRRKFIVAQAQIGRVSIPGALATRRRHPGSASVVRSACVAAEWMVVGDFHESDSEAVGIFDPHLDQSPWLPSRRLCDRHASGPKPLVLRSDIAHLHPERETHRWLLGLTGDLKQAVS